MERVAFVIVRRGFIALTRLYDKPYRRRNPGWFRLYWYPSWLTRWEQRLARQGRTPRQDPLSR